MLLLYRRGAALQVKMLLQRVSMTRLLCDCLYYQLSSVCSLDTKDGDRQGGWLEMAGPWTAAAWQNTHLNRTHWENFKNLTRSQVREINTTKIWPCNCQSPLNCKWLHCGAFNVVIYPNFPSWSDPQLLKHWLLTNCTWDTKLTLPRCFVTVYPLFYKSVY